MGVPVGTPMSIPGWQASQARRSQNGEVIGPLTGQMKRPTLADRAAAGEVALDPGLLRLHGTHVLLELLREERVESSAACSPACRTTPIAARPAFGENARGG